MRVLLDTHVFLWWVTNDARLSSRARDLISNGENEIMMSAASGWEIAIKSRLGRIQLPEDPERFVPEQIISNGFNGLPILLDHALRVYALPDHHRDPFDRMLVAQGQIEHLPIITADPQIAKYDVEVIW
jgi:PIN domain nuclease of toxin-antitoxin system